MLISKLFLSFISPMAYNIVVTVTPSPTVVAIAAADSVCVNWENVTLSGSPAGGVFSGNSVTDNRFYPPVAGVGVHDVVFRLQEN